MLRTSVRRRPSETRTQGIGGYGRRNVTSEDRLDLPPRAERFGWEEEEIGYQIDEAYDGSGESYSETPLVVLGLVGGPDSFLGVYLSWDGVGQGESGRHFRSRRRTMKANSENPN